MRHTLSALIAAAALLVPGAAWSNVCSGGTSDGADCNSVAAKDTCVTGGGKCLVESDDPVIHSDMTVFGDLDPQKKTGSAEALYALENDEPAVASACSDNPAGNRMWLKDVNSASATMDWCFCEGQTEVLCLPATGATENWFRFNDASTGDFKLIERSAAQMRTDLDVPQTTDLTTPTQTPGANEVPQSDADGRLDPAWLTRAPVADCTAETGGETGELCVETDGQLYSCPSGPCSASGWVAIDTDTTCSDSTCTIASPDTVADDALTSNVGLLDSVATILGNWVNTANPWADNEVADDLTVSGGSISATPIVLDQGAAPAPTAEGDIEWETDDDHIIVGADGASVEFVPAEDVSGDVTMDDDGVVTIGDQTVQPSDLDTDATWPFNASFPFLVHDTVSGDEFRGQDAGGMRGLLSVVQDDDSDGKITLSDGDEISGTLYHEGGGLEADVSLYAGLIRIDSGTTSNVTDLSGLNTALGGLNITDGPHTATAVTDGLIVEADLDEDSGTPIDEDVLTYDSTGANFNWVAQSAITAGAATALAANAGNCAAGEIPLGVDTLGAVEGCYEPSEADISDLVHTEDTTCLDGGVDCLFAASASEGGAATSVAAGSIDATAIATGGVDLDSGDVTGTLPTSKMDADVLVEGEHAEGIDEDLDGNPEVSADGTNVDIDPDSDGTPNTAFFTGTGGDQCIEVGADTDTTGNACICSTGTRLYGDQNCDGDKDPGELFVDEDLAAADNFGNRTYVSKNGAASGDLECGARNAPCLDPRDAIRNIGDCTNADRCVVKVASGTYTVPGPIKFQFQCDSDSPAVQAAPSTGKTILCDGICEDHPGDTCRNDSECPSGLCVSQVDTTNCGAGGVCESKSWLSMIGEGSSNSTSTQGLTGLTNFQIQQTSGAIIGDSDDDVIAYDVSRTKGHALLGITVTPLGSSKCAIGSDGNSVGTGLWGAAAVPNGGGERYDRNTGICWRGFGNGTLITWYTAVWPAQKFTDSALYWIETASVAGEGGNTSCDTQICQSADIIFSNGRDQSGGSGLIQLNAVAPATCVGGDRAGFGCDPNLFDDADAQCAAGGGTCSGSPKAYAANPFNVRLIGNGFSGVSNDSGVSIKDSACVDTSLPSPWLNTALAGYPSTDWECGANRNQIAATVCECSASVCANCDVAFFTTGTDGQSCSVDADCRNLMCQNLVGTGGQFDTCDENADDAQYGVLLAVTGVCDTGSDLAGERCLVDADCMATPVGGECLVGPTTNAGKVTMLDYILNPLDSGVTGLETSPEVSVATAGGDLLYSGGTEFDISIACIDVDDDGDMDLLGDASTPCPGGRTDLSVNIGTDPGQIDSTFGNTVMRAGLATADDLRDVDGLTGTGAYLVTQADGTDHTDGNLCQFDGAGNIEDGGTFSSKLATEFTADSDILVGTGSGAYAAEDLGTAVEAEAVAARTVDIDGDGTDEIKSGGLGGLVIDANDDGQLDFEFAPLGLTDRILSEGTGAADGFDGSLIFTNNTGTSKTWTLPNKSGTVVMHSTNGESILYERFEMATCPDGSNAVAGMDKGHYGPAMTPTCGGSGAHYLATPAGTGAQARRGFGRLPPSWLGNLQMTVWWKTSDTTGTVYLKTYVECMTPSTTDTLDFSDTTGVGQKTQGSLSSGNLYATVLTNPTNLATECAAGDLFWIQIEKPNFSHTGAIQFYAMEVLAW